MAKVGAYRCAHSGLYFPPDYIKEWGRKYGIGLGKRPVSEVLNTDYTMPVAVCDKNLGKSMIPFGNTFAQLDFISVEESEYEKNKAVLAIEDGDYEVRAAIIQAKQIKKSGKLKAILEKAITP